MERAEHIIVSANIPTMDMNQLSILTHIDMMMNRTLLDEVHKELDKIFKLYAGAIAKIRKSTRALQPLLPIRPVEEKGRGDQGWGG